jgi:large subunit ribosomal protein L29
MKAKEIRDLSNEEIAQRIKEEKEQLEHLEFQHAVAELPNPMLIREKRRLLARLTTVMKEATRA